MTNPAEKNELLEETSQAPVEWYDDLPPASQNRPETFGTWLTRTLVKEFNQTLYDVNKILIVLDEFEKLTAPRQTLSGETVPSPLAESILRVLKENKVDETIREQFSRMQNSPFKANLEDSVRQYWEELKARGKDLNQQLKMVIPQPSSTKIQTEEYHSDEVNTHTRYTSPDITPVEVSPGTVPAQELLLDIFEEAGSTEILIVAEHPGLIASTIQVTLNHDILTINAQDASQETYHKEALLPFPVEQDNFTQQYRNGVLEIHLKKLVGPLG
ncbi:MAG: hypothetical protein JWP00_3372 [Chloroflexi bacterium]|nr:hypothetical protein [Chloroflexota bacterium]